MRDLPILVGAFFVLTAAVGVVRFPDLYARLHASSKLVTLGSAGIFLGVAFAMNDAAAFTRLAAVLLFQFLTTPLAAYLIAQAAYLRGLPPILGDGGPGRGTDDWGALGQADRVAQADRDAQQAMTAEGE
nr:monovalent cation/H(+) antiporter subunit G [Deinococcus budaensis]